MVQKKFGYSKNLRLRTPAEFQKVFLRPIRSKSRFFTVLAQPNNEEISKLGIIVAKRFVKRAHDRNKIRRLIRESFRHHQEMLAGLSIVVLLRENKAQTLTSQQFFDELNYHWLEVIKLWKKY